MNSDMTKGPSQLSKKQSLLFGGGLLVAFALIVPVTALALTAVTNLVLAGVMFFAFVALIMAAPSLVRFWRTMVLKMMKENVRRNPIETLQLELIKRQQAFVNAQQQVVTIVGTRDSLKEELAEYERKYGKSDDALGRMVDKLSDLADRLQSSLKQTNLKLHEFDRFVEQQAARWKIAKQTGDLATMLRDTHGGDVTDKFLQDTAIDSIRTELNTSFAEIDQILSNDDVQQALSRDSHLPIATSFTTGELDALPAPGKRDS